METIEGTVQYINRAGTGLQLIEYNGWFTRGSRYINFSHIPVGARVRLGCEPGPDGNHWVHGLTVSK